MSQHGAVGIVFRFVYHNGIRIVRLVQWSQKNGSLAKRKVEQVMLLAGN